MDGMSDDTLDRPSLPPPPSVVAGVSALTPVATVTRCVGAYRRVCFNTTRTILCDDCYAIVDRYGTQPHGRAAHDGFRWLTDKGRDAARP